MLRSILVGKRPANSLNQIPPPSPAGQGVRHPRVNPRRYLVVSVETLPIVRTWDFHSTFHQIQYYRSAPIPAIIQQQLMQATDLIHGDRRANRRYAFEMPLHFVCQCGPSQFTGSGYTKNLARKGVFFIPDNPPCDPDIELAIDWPFLLQNVCRLELRVWGRVVRSDARGTAIRMNRYEFRTCGERSFDQAIAREVNCDMVA